MVHAGNIFSIKISKEKELVLVFQRDITRNDRIKLARGQSDVKFIEISPLSICFLPFKSEMQSRKSSGPSL